MAEPQETTEPKKRFTMSEQQKAAMAEGRRIAAERRAKGLPPLPKVKKTYPRRDRPAPETQAVEPPPAREDDTNNDPDVDDDPLGVPTNGETAPNYASRKPRTLLDIMAFYPIGDGQFSVSVERKSPVMFNQQRIGGMQRRIWSPMKEDVFASVYGGGEYELRVYGPLRPGQVDLDDAGNPKEKPYTDAIKHSVPGPPNPDSAEELPPMQPNGRLERRPIRSLTSADAELRRVELGHKETMDERNDRRARERAEREAAERAERERTDLERERLNDQRNERELERLQRVNEENLKIVREAERAKAEANKGLGLPEVLAILNTNKPDDSARIEQIMTQHRDEMRRLVESHENALRLERDRADRAIRDADQRAEDRVRLERDACQTRVRDVEQSAERRFNELEQRRTRELKECEEKAERLREETDRRCKERIDDLVRAHASEIAAIERTHQSELRAFTMTSETSQRSTVESWQLRHQTTEAELQRLRAELARVNTELTEARARADNWMEQWEKFQERAEALGFSQGGGESETKDEEMSWKGLVAEVLKNGAAQLPAVTEKIGQVLNARQAMQQQAAPRQDLVARSHNTVPHLNAIAPPPPAYGQQALPFATDDDGPNFMAPVPRMPMPRDPAPSMAAPPPPPVAAPPQQPMVVTDPQHALPPMPPQAPMQSVAPPQHAPQQQAEPPTEQDGISSLIYGLATSYESGTQPAQVAADVFNGVLASVNGDEAQAKSLIGSFSLEQLNAILASHKSEAAQKLQRREGQKFLQEVWKALQTKRN